MSVERDPIRERDDLAEALKPLMGTIDFYIGPNARTAVGQDTVRSYERLSLALRRARGEACPRCNDTGIDRHYAYGPHPCALRHEPGHLIELPPEVIARMIELRDKDRAEDANPDPERGHRLGPPRYEAELESLAPALPPEGR